MNLKDRFAAAMPGLGSVRIGVAVSGGSDSVALLTLTCEWAGADTQVEAITVDHGLRDGSAEEATFVAKQAARLGAKHTTLRWQDWTGDGNLQAEARTARYRLITDHCTRHDIQTVLLGHTQNDQAETLLMRVARGSGVDGLAAMRVRHGIFLRPLLQETRQDLRSYLTARDIAWIDDPSNDDPRFDRVRVRQAMEALNLDPKRLSDTAAAMARAQEALEIRAHDVAQRSVTDQNGIISFDAAALAKTEAETRFRLVAHALKCLSSAPYRPRLSALTTTLKAALNGQGGTLHGCRFLPHKDRLLLVREYETVKNKEVSADGAVWDGRWTFTSPGHRVAPLGPDGLKQMGTPQNLPHAALLSYPGLWDGPILLAVPGFFNDTEPKATYLPSASFHPTLLSH